VKQNSLGPFMFAVLVVSVCLLAASMPACASQVSDATRCRVVNLMPPFWRSWDAAKDQPQSAQLLLFDEMVVKEHPEVYRESVLGVGSTLGLVQGLRRSCGALRRTLRRCGSSAIASKATYPCT
jgi:hypothetical protein